MEWFEFSRLKHELIRLKKLIKTNTKSATFCMPDRYTIIYAHDKSVYSRNRDPHTGANRCLSSLGDIMTGHPR